MLHTHPSHFDVTMKQNEYYVFFSGKLNNVKRIAYAHGLEITHTEKEGTIYERIHLNHGIAVIERDSGDVGGYTLRMGKKFYEEN